MRKRFTYANIVATLALVFAMSGGALAANHYLINSTKQINPKVLKKLKGKPGTTGATGKAGAAGAVGTNGTNGKEGPAGPFVSQVPSGKTLTGSYSFVAKTAIFYGAEVSYPFALPAEPTSAIFLEVGQKEEAHCPGNAEDPKAAAGFLCIYRGFSLNTKVGSVFITNHTGERNNKGDTHGFVVEGMPTGEGVVFDQGTWAYTAP